MDENTLRAAASRFGEVAKVEIVKSKACAFVEFKHVEAARKAIIASLSVQQGGEGGVRVPGGEGKLNFETRKEKEDRRKAQGGAAASGATGGQGQSSNQRQGGGAASGRGGMSGGERGGAAGRGRGRGRGGPAGGQGERSAPAAQQK